ncbi:MAG: hypothetical protein JNL81_09245 [Hyphomonadaceae bacterium]|nr:hypothetical protein [Hyphomonadaceae bacterium]
MKARILFLTCAFVLAACGQRADMPETPEAATARELVLACADFAATTPDALAQRFGAENVTTQTLPGAEGETYEATVVFADDASRRLVVTWNEARTLVASVSVNNIGTQWKGAGGFTVGTPIAEIERLNVMPFKLWGFGWDYGGWVSDWGLGAFAQSPVPGCSTRMRFTPRGPENVSAMGDTEFGSNEPAIRAADPVVSEFGLMLSAPDAGN